MRLTKEIAHEILTSVADDEKLPMYYELQKIVEDYRLELKEEGLLAEVKVTSASPLSDDFKEKLQILIQNYWEADYTINYTVDSNLIGGIRLEVNNAVVDTTLQSRINQILREV